MVWTVSAEPWEGAVYEGHTTPGPKGGRELLGPGRRKLYTEGCLERSYDSDPMTQSA